MDHKSFNSSCCSSMSIDNIRKINTIGAATSFLVENDDEEDKNIRRKSRARSILNAISEPANVTNDQLRDIYSTCIKLSTENKISSKNAFGLQLIDYMQEVLQQHKEEHGTNFQVASCTLDASVKIYGYRVDSIHLDTFRMAGTLGHGVEPNENEHNNSNDGVNEEEKPNPKQRKAAKNPEKESHSKLETNLKNIQLDKVEVEEESNLWNVIFARKPISSAFGRSGPEAYILNNYNISSDYGYICIDPFSKPIDSPIPILQENNIELPEEKLQFFNKYTDEKANQVKFVEQLYNFSYTSWEPPEKRQSLSSNLLSLILKNHTNNEEEHPQFKEESGLSQIRPFIQSPEFNENMDASFDDHGDIDANLSLHEANENFEKLQFGNQEGININANPFCNELSTQPGEYSYFVNAFDPAGAAKKELASFNISKINLLSKLAAPRQLASHDRKRKAGKKKVQPTINFEDEFTREEQKCLIPSHTKKSFMNIHKAENINQSTIDVSNPINENILFTLFLIPFTVLNLDIFDKIQKNSQLNMVAYSEDGKNFPINEHENLIGDDDYDDDGFNIDEDKSNKEAKENSFLNNLVPQPQTVNRLFIKYAKVSKKLDTRAVKVAMWDLLENNLLIEPTDSEDPLVFTNVYKKLPNHLSKTVSENLSPQLAFVCLLHLANEKNILLRNSDDLKTIHIDLLQNTAS